MSSEIIRRAKLEIALRADGVLVLLLPGVAGRSREVVCTDEAVGSSARRILSAPDIARGLGLEGEPTADLVVHWEKHVDWPKANCPHCISEGRVHGSSGARERARVLSKRSDGVEIRIQRIPERGSGSALKGKVDVDLDELFPDE